MATAYTYGDFLAALEYLEQEGFIERFTNEKGEEMVRICEGAESL
jgi:hypothetical protein